MVSSENGNCVPDDVPVLNVSSASSSKRETGENRSLTNDRDPKKVINENITDLPELVLNVAAFISGFVVLQLRKQKWVKNCPVCSAMLKVCRVGEGTNNELLETQYADLIRIKRKGGLVLPSNEEIINLCIFLEKILRANPSSIYSNDFSTLATEVAVNKFTAKFESHEHTREYWRTHVLYFYELV